MINLQGMIHPKKKRNKNLEEIKKQKTNVSYIIYVSAHIELNQITDFIKAAPAQ